MRASLFALLTGLLLAQASMAKTASTTGSVVIDNRQIAINFGTIMPSLIVAGTATVGLSNNLSTANLLASNTPAVRSAVYSMVGNPPATSR